jgi:hypothetical protein
MEITLSKAIQKDGQEIQKLTLDLDKLRGADIVRAEREARMRGDLSPNPVFSTEGLAIVAAKASGMIPEDIMDLSAPDFLLVTNTVNNFLYGWVFPTSTQSETSEKPS